ncbi:hypothetical protein SAMN05421874_14636 [Nonomuraea maritima]|uniref:Uncharacterized protein n=1 Tax=Nonomuraea maritima TaxID=683260 RepID=A0A1G9RKU2_9ACTN|nr:hypothetical protein [Nonomuraea maritima]SDM23537.1 hypothetical protein SAMN05421874_14636 [Nonomuraea maritima]
MQFSFTPPMKGQDLNEVEWVDGTAIDTAKSRTAAVFGRRFWTLNAQVRATDLDRGVSF